MYRTEQRRPDDAARIERMQQEQPGCPTCKSSDTIRTEATLARYTRYCFDCRRSFDVQLSDPPERHRRDDLSNAYLAQRRR